MTPVEDVETRLRALEAKNTPHPLGIPKAIFQVYGDTGELSTAEGTYGAVKVRKPNTGVYIVTLAEPCESEIIQITLLHENELSATGEAYIVWGKLMTPEAVDIVIKTFVMASGSANPQPRDAWEITVVVW